MKTLIFLAALVMLFHQPVFARASGRQPGRFAERLMGNLPPAEQEKLKAAREKAMKDPKVQAAFEDMRATAKESHETLHAALLKADPSLQTVLDKMKATRMERRKAGAFEEDAEKAGAGRFGASLAPEERSKLQAALQKVRANADVKAAHARTQEARRLFLNALRTAMLSADPTVAPLLEKIPAKSDGAGLS